MKPWRLPGWTGCFSLIMLGLLWAGPLLAQTYSSGSTGALGSFNPTSNTTVTLPPDGILHYTTVNITAGVTVTFARNAANTPVLLLTTGDVTVSGTIGVNGATGPNPSVTPAPGGPGGFSGGLGGSPPGGGSGPGGGAPSGAGNSNATFGAPSAFVSLLPLFGGSGGGGAIVNSISSAGGGGGGGAIVIASSTRIIVTATGRINANGGSGLTGVGGTAFHAGGGSGGAIRLVAPEVTGTGELSALGGSGGGGVAPAGIGLIRIESFTPAFTGTVNPPATISAAPGPVTAAGTPALTSLPTLTISSVGGIAPPGAPGGSYTTADVSLPSGTTNPVPGTLAVANVPVGTVFTVRLLPKFGNPTTVASTASSGTFAASTATAGVTFPAGQVSVLNAFGSFTLPQIAGLLPLIDGEPVDRVLVAAAYGESSTVTLMTPSGREARPEELPFEAQLKLAWAIERLAAAP